MTNKTEIWWTIACGNVLLPWCAASTRRAAKKKFEDNGIKSIELPHYKPVKIKVSRHD